MLKRRSLLTTPALLLTAASPALTLEAGDSARREALLTWPNGSVFVCPATRARLVATLATGPIDRLRPLAILRFGADAGDAVQDLFAFVDQRARLLALEIAAWQGPGGEALTTRPVLLPDRAHIALERSAAGIVSVSGSGRRHEFWTDYLRLDETDLQDAPQHPIPPGTLQHALIARRTAFADRLRPPPFGLPPALLAAARQAGSPLAE